MKNNPNELYIKMMKYFDERREEIKKAIEEHDNFRKIDREVLKEFYRFYNYLNDLSDEIIDEMRSTYTEYDYNNDMYLDYIDMDDEFYKFVYKVLFLYGVEIPFI